MTVPMMLSCAEPPRSRLADRARQVRHDAAEDDDRDAVADAVSVISSPIQTNNIVPAVIDSRMAQWRKERVAIEKTEVLQQRHAAGSLLRENSSAWP